MRTFLPYMSAPVVTLFFLLIPPSLGDENCTPELMAAIKAQKELFCNKGYLQGRSCKRKKLTPAQCAFNATAYGMCIPVRISYDYCFPGNGDKGHAIQVDDMVKAQASCLACASTSVVDDAAKIGTRTVCKKAGKKVGIRIVKGLVKGLATSAEGGLIFASLLHCADASSYLGDSWNTWGKSSDEIYLKMGEAELLGCKLVDEFYPELGNVMNLKDEAEACIQDFMSKHEGSWWDLIPPVEICRLASAGTDPMWGACQQKIVNFVSAVNKLRSGMDQYLDCPRSQSTTCEKNKEGDYCKQRHIYDCCQAPLECVFSNSNDPEEKRLRAGTCQYPSAPEPTSENECSDSTKYPSDTDPINSTQSPGPAVPFEDPDWNYR